LVIHFSVLSLVEASVANIQIFLSLCCQQMHAETSHTWLRAHTFHT